MKKRKRRNKQTRSRARSPSTQSGFGRRYKRHFAAERSQFAQTDCTGYSTLLMYNRSFSFSFVLIISGDTLPFQPPLSALGESISKTYSHGNEKTDTQYSRAIGVVIGDCVPVSDLIDAPQIESHAIEESETANDGEGPGGGERNSVAKVEKSGCDRAQDD